MHQHDTPQQQQHLHHSHSEGVERLVRKKPKLESKVLNISAAADASRGPRDYMEDTHTVRDDLKFYGVYDGHGGEQAAKLLQNLLHTNIVSSHHYNNGNIEEAIHEAFTKVDKQILQASLDQKWDSGTTAVVALIQDRKLYIANCGDSEAVLGRRKPKKNTKSKDTHSSNKMQNHRPRPTTPLSCAISEDDNTIESNSAAHLSSSGCSLTDSLGMLGMSPTAVLSHLSLASPRKAVPRFRSRNNSFSSENNSYNANGNNSTPTTPTAPISPSTPPFDKILLPNIPNNDHRNTNHNTDGQNGTTNHADTTNINGTTHKRSHSPKDTEENGYKEEEEGEREEEEEEDDCECDDEDSEFEFEEAGPSLSENIQTYLKDNPNSYFCRKEECGVFEPVVLTKCHRPSCEEEIERIAAAGGAVTYGRVSGELAVTRSFGDIQYKHPHNKASADFVSVLPHIRVLDLQPSDEFLILASDGLWDVLSHKEAVDIISKYRSAGDSRQACEDLVDEALRKNSFDNVTVVFLSFKWTNAP